jgi:ERCC4-type nuclease
VLRRAAARDCIPAVAHDALKQKVLIRKGAYCHIASPHNRIKMYNGDGDLVLLVDHQERNRATNPTRNEMINMIDRKVNAQYPRPGRPYCEVALFPSKRLPVGDYAIILRKSTGEERVLDFCVERKTKADLGRCITESNTTHSPYTKMEVQLKKLSNCGLSNKIFLFEESYHNTHAPQRGLLAADTFVQELEEGRHEGVRLDHRGLRLHRSDGIYATIDFLADQLIAMVQLQSRGQPLPFPKDSIPRTLNGVKDKVDSALKDKTFLFSVQLRRIPGVGEETAKAVVAGFPNRESLEELWQGHPEFGARSQLLSSAVNIRRSAVESIVKAFGQGSPATPNHSDHSVATRPPSQDLAGRAARSPTRPSHNPVAPIQGNAKRARLEEHVVPPPQKRHPPIIEIDWNCGRCQFSNKNKPHALACGSCRAPRHDSQTSWSCHNCSFLNDKISAPACCDMCEAARF